MQDKPRVLLLDDEERILRSLTLLLRGPYEVLTTTSGLEAVQLLSRQTIHVRELTSGSHDVLWAATIPAALEFLGHESVAPVQPRRHFSGERSRTWILDR